jgi:hypothetical protein
MMRPPSQDQRPRRHPPRANAQRSALEGRGRRRRGGRAAAEQLPPLNKDAADTVVRPAMQWGREEEERTGLPSSSGIMVGQTPTAQRWRGYRHSAPPPSPGRTMKARKPLAFWPPILFTPSSARLAAVLDDTSMMNAKQATAGAPSPLMCTDRPSDGMMRSP